MLLAVDVGNTNTVLGLYRLDGETASAMGRALRKDRFDLTRIGASRRIARRRG